MDVFSLRDQLIADYSAFARSFTTISAGDIRKALDAEYASGRFWPDPLISVNPRFKAAKTGDQMAKDGEILPITANVFRLHHLPDRPSVRFHQHQYNALAIARQQHSFVVTTGTGSGKSLCYFLPILDSILRQKAEDATPRTRAIVIYPMNALANSQIEEIGKFLKDSGASLNVRRITGQESSDERNAIAADPPDILLTNFMMLELLLVRQSERDQAILKHCKGLQFLVLDELHTYRGRQGSDVGLLVRRLRQRTQPESLVCIGTSATMTSEGAASERSKVVAGVASRLFGTEVQYTDVITEDLEFRTDQPAPSAPKPALGPLIGAGWPTGLSNAEFAKHPLAIWLEARIGIFRPADGMKLERAQPKTLPAVAQALAQESGQPVEDCLTILRDLLLAAAQPENQRTGREDGSPEAFFAFKLHQFISGARTALATLQPAPQEDRAPATTCPICCVQATSSLGPTAARMRNVWTPTTASSWLCSGMRLSTGALYRSSHPALSSGPPA